MILILELWEVTQSWLVDIEEIRLFSVVDYICEKCPEHLHGIEECHICNWITIATGDYKPPRHEACEATEERQNLLDNLEVVVLVEFKLMLIMTIFLSRMFMLRI